MACYSDDIHVIAVDETDDGLVLTARTGHVGKVILCYVSGELLDRQRPQGGMVSFTLPAVAPHEVITLLAADADQESQDCADALAAAGGGGTANRIEVRMLLDMLDGRRPGDVWRVYLGRTGSQQADELAYEAPVFPGGRGSTGWGVDWGRGGWGYDGSNSPGWASRWGYTWGFETGYLTWLSRPVPRGRYPLRVEAADRLGNTSEAFETTVTVDAFARPAAELAVASYSLEQDTLVLGMNPSEDIA